MIAQLTQQEDLARLCRVSKPLCSSARPRLYEAIIIKPKDGGDWVNSMNVEPYLRTCSGSQNCLHFVKSIRVVAPFHKVLREICPNRIETDLSDDHDSDHGQNATGDAILADGEDERRKVDDVSHTARVHSNQLTSNSLPVHPNVDKPSTDLCPLTTKLMPLLLQLQDDSLRSFQ